MFGVAGEIIKLSPATGETRVAANYDSGVVDDGPQFTGIFGTIGALEPNAIGHPAAPVSSAAKSVQHGRWPPRFAALPPRVQK